jgi:uncharacterized membrane protein
MKDDVTASLNQFSERRDGTKKFYNFACYNYRYSCNYLLLSITVSALGCGHLDYWDRWLECLSRRICMFTVVCVTGRILALGGSSLMMRKTLKLKFNEFHTLFFFLVYLFHS